MTIKVGGGAADYDLAGFISKLQSGMGLSADEPIQFDVTARSDSNYEKLKAVLESRGIQVIEIRHHDVQTPPQPSFEEDEFPLIKSAQNIAPPQAAPEEIPSPSFEVDEQDAEDEYENTDSQFSASMPAEVEAMLAGVSSHAHNTGDDEDTPLAYVYTFGSSKGGSGKTFTCIASARRYAQLHPEKKIALIDLDIIDAQVGISLHYVAPNVNNSYISWLSNGENFDLSSSQRTTDALGPNLHVFAGNSSGLEKDRYPDDFWIDFLTKVVQEYDTVFIDTGIDYLNIEPIRMAYQIADRIVVLSGTSIKSITSIKKQLTFLSGISDGSPYDSEMEIIGKVGIVFTQWEQGNPVEQVPSLLQNMTKIGDVTVPVLVKFGYIKYISEIEFLGNWKLADNKKFQQGFDRIVGS